jgi:NADPH:quinone reductase
MMPLQNKEIRLASRPTGVPTEENFHLTHTTIGEPAEGEVLLRTKFISVDPYLRGRMRDRRSYVPPFEIGQVISSALVGEVMESRSVKLKPGDLVTGYGGWRLYNIVNPDEWRKLPEGFPPSASLGVLGATGLTAYFGLLDVGQPKEGETLVVSGAAGAVGMTVCQIAKIKGCRVVGIAGGPNKQNYLQSELGIDVALDYKHGDIREALQRACPDGVDIYFDNVGGEISDAVISLINKRARVIICGQISIYNSDKLEVGVKPQPYLLINSAVMQGFIITDYMPRFPEGIVQLGQWFAEGRLKYAETIVEGFENTPAAFIGLFSGANLGKQIVKVE